MTNQLTPKPFVIIVLTGKRTVMCGYLTNSSLKHVTLTDCRKLVFKRHVPDKDLGTHMYGSDLESFDTLANLAAHGTIPAEAAEVFGVTKGVVVPTRSFDQTHVVEVLKCTPAAEATLNNDEPLETLPTERPTEDMEMHAEGTWGWAKNELLSGRAGAIQRADWNTAIIVLAKAGGVATHFAMRQLVASGVPEPMDLAWEPGETDQNSDWRVVLYNNTTETIEEGTWVWALQAMVHGNHISNKRWDDTPLTGAVLFLKVGKFHIYLPLSGVVRPLALSEVHTSALGFYIHNTWLWAEQQLSDFTKKVRCSSWKPGQYVMLAAPKVVNAGSPMAPKEPAYLFHSDGALTSWVPSGAELELEWEMAEAEPQAAPGTWDWANHLRGIGVKVRRKTWPPEQFASEDYEPCEAALVAADWEADDSDLLSDNAADQEGTWEWASKQLTESSELLLAKRKGWSNNSYVMCLKQFGTFGFCRLTVTGDDVRNVPWASLEADKETKVKITDWELFSPTPCTWDWAKHMMWQGACLKRKQWPNGLHVYCLKSPTLGTPSFWVKLADGNYDTYTPSEEDRKALNWYECIPSDGLHWHQVVYIATTSTNKYQFRRASTDQNEVGVDVPSSVILAELAGEQTIITNADKHAHNWSIVEGVKSE